MPSFVSTKAEMICSGILPIDHMRDHVPAVSHISFLCCWHLQNPAADIFFGKEVLMNIKGAVCRVYNRHLEEVKIEFVYFVHSKIEVVRLLSCNFYDIRYY